MAAGIVYLDVDDEITSAASRIRSAPGTKVALVVPYGSRIATSRMNFRLLSREALVSNRRLSIVSGDAAARSLAASAGLPAFGSVGEYESSIAAEGAVAEAAATADAADEPIRPGDVDATLATSATIVSPPPPSSGPPPAGPTRKSQTPRRPVVELPAEPTPADRFAAPDPAAGPAEALADDEAIAAGLPPLFGTRIRGPIVAAIALITLALIVVGVGAYLFLPSAEIVLTPRREPIGPIELTVSADPEATSVDPVNLVVPAIRLDVPVEARKTFETTGVHVEEAAATGSVTFTNYDTSDGVSIPRGSIVSTEGGTRFRTGATVALQPAAVFPAFEPTSDSVAVTAVRAGEGGNVPANTIRVVPEGKDPVLLRVNNPAATSGGSHTETPEVTKAEVEKAVAALGADLQAAFDAAIAGGAGAPAGTTLFPKTATLGAATPDVDPASLIGQAVESYDLRLTATGTVIAVDPSPVEAIAETQLEGRIKAGYRLVAGSADIVPGEGLVGEDGSVSFLATARATQVAVVDAGALRELVKGKTAADARAALQPYGEATVVLWPDWASTVTTMDARLTITVNDDSTGTPGASGNPSPAPSGRSSPSRSPAPPGTASPAPS
jgi:hypothetical protein